MGLSLCLSLSVSLSVPLSVSLSLSLCLCLSLSLSARVCEFVCMRARVRARACVARSRPCERSKSGRPVNIDLKRKTKTGKHRIKKESQDRSTQIQEPDNTDPRASSTIPLKINPRGQELTLHSYRRTKNKKTGHGDNPKHPSRGCLCCVSCAAVMSSILDTGTTSPTEIFTPGEKNPSPHTTQPSPRITYFARTVTYRLAVRTCTACG